MYIIPNEYFENLVNPLTVQYNVQCSDNNISGLNNKKKVG